ncbi:transposase [Nocardia sp. alder85J]|uniref:transposase n=1 Tax=Nocardia sp. alder85J TaxID=2862949 RepID=UPI003A4D9705
MPKSLQPLLDAFRPCFTTPTFTTFVALTIGVIAAPARRTVCGMLTAARMGGHHARAHRFFATAAWSLDHVGLTVLGLVVGWLTPTGAPLLIAIAMTRCSGAVARRCTARCGPTTAPAKSPRDKPNSRAAPRS